MRTNSKKGHSASALCPGCGRKARLIWRVSDPNSGHHDLRQFSCACGAQFGDKVLRESDRAEVA